MQVTSFIGINTIEPLSILIAEDNAINIKVILRILKLVMTDLAIKYNTIVAENGKEAVDRFQAAKFHLIFMGNSSIHPCDPRYSHACHGRHRCHKGNHQQNAFR